MLVKLCLQYGLMSAKPDHRRLRQDNHDLEISLHYIKRQRGEGREKLKKFRERIRESSLPTAMWQGLGMKDTRENLPAAMLHGQDKCY